MVQCFTAFQVRLDSLKGRAGAVPPLKVVKGHLVVRHRSRASHQPPTIAIDIVLRKRSRTFLRVSVVAVALGLCEALVQTPAAPVEKVSYAAPVEKVSYRTDTHRLAEEA